VAGEGDGPLQPLPVKSDTLFVASDPFLADFVLARWMGFDCQRIPQLVHRGVLPTPSSATSTRERHGAWDERLIQGWEPAGSALFETGSRLGVYPGGVECDDRQGQRARVHRVQGLLGSRVGARLESSCGLRNRHRMISGSCNERGSTGCCALLFGMSLLSGTLRNDDRLRLEDLPALTRRRSATTSGLDVPGGERRL